MTTVIYHSADYGGILCREIARKFLPHSADCDTRDGSPDAIAKPCNCIRYIGWNFGDAPLEDIPEGLVYIMDLPVDKPLGLTNPGWIEQSLEHGRTLIWIDHHKSSIESHPKDIPGYRIDGVAACRLAWQWFASRVDGYQSPSDDTSCERLMPDKQHYIDRKVTEPLAVRLAGEYDIWDHRGDGDLELQYGLRTEEPEPNWDWLLDDKPEYTRQLIAQGKCAMAYAKHVDASVVNTRSYLTQWEGLRWLTMNSIRCNSLSFAAKDVPETGHDALLAYYFNGKAWTVSLYHARHRTDLDLSQIAVKYGGGGHRGACGFTCDALPAEWVGQRQNAE